MTTVSNIGKPFLNKRDAMLELPEVGETLSVFGYSLSLMKSLKLGNITNDEFELLSGDLELHCRHNNIQTENEICALF